MVDNAPGLVFKLWFSPPAGRWGMIGKEGAVFRKACPGLDPEDHAQTKSWSEMTIRGNVISAKAGAGKWPT